MAKARIAVIGAGLMGHGIAQVFALAGHDVTIYDSVAASLDSAKAREMYRRFVGYWKDGDLDRERVAEAEKKLRS